MMSDDGDLKSLADQFALGRLVDLYARAIDRCDLSLLRSLYADDAIHDHGAMFRGGSDAFAAFIGANMRAMRTHHFMGNRLFVIDADDAEGEVYSINSHVIERDGALHDYIAAGRYLDRYRRTKAGWRIQFRSRIIDWSHERPHQPGGTASGLAIGGKHPDDPSYQMRLLTGL